MKAATLTKATVPVVLGVLIAGFIMYQGRDISLIAQARAGYDV